MFCDKIIIVYLGLFWYLAHIHFWFHTHLNQSTCLPCYKITQMYYPTAACYLNKDSSQSQKMTSAVTDVECSSASAHIPTNEIYK